jgi:penicillin-binding protein 1A
MNRRRFLLARLLLGAAGAGAAALIIVALAVVLVIAPTLPSIENLRDVQLKVPLRVYTADGLLMAEYGEERRIPVAVGDAPPLLTYAVLAAEDDSFYSHGGVDFLGIARAALANLRSGEHEQGASTITMQVARNYFLSPEKTYTRKIKEILLSFKIERELSKDEILALYLNKIFLGHRAYGFQAAAQVYYGHELSELTLPQLAMLAGLPKAPSRNNPISNPDGARERRNYVLKRMYELGHIDEATYREARAAPITASRHTAVTEIDAPYVAEMVRQYMVERYGDAAYTAGYKVTTTISAEAQRAADEALRDGLIAYDHRHGYRGAAGHVDVGSVSDRQGLDEALASYDRVGAMLPAVVLEVRERELSAYTVDGQVAEVGWSGLSWARRYLSAYSMGAKPKAADDIAKVGDVVYLQHGEDGWALTQVPEIAGALVSLKPNDGAIVALTGGFNYYQSKFNRAIQAERQPGSNIKPFIYSAALEKGFTAASRISGAPIVVRDVSLEDIWRPENYSGKFFGPTSLRDALRLSLNLVSIRLLRAIGPAYAVNYLSRFGFDPAKLPANLSLALGTASLTPLEMVRAFAVFANGGYRIEPYFIQKVESGDGETVESAEPAVVCPTCLRPEDYFEAGISTLPPEQLPLQHYAPRAITPENAFVMTTMMRSVVTSGTGRRAQALGRSDVAGKTGTTNDYRDAWFSGFTPRLVTTVWTGFDQPATLGRSETGGRVALPIWVDYMRVALKGIPVEPFVPPLGVTTAYVNRETGQPTVPDDPDGYEEYFIVGLEQKADIAAAQDSETAPVIPEQINPAEKKIPEGLF